MKKYFLISLSFLSFSLKAFDQAAFLEGFKDTVQKIKHTFYRQAARLGAASRIGLCHEGPLTALPALHQAVLSGDLVKVKEILHLPGTSIEVVDANGITALHWAAFKNHYDIAVYLIQNGAKIDATDNNGWTPLHYASERGHYELVVYLINKAGANRRARTNKGATAWWIAQDRRVLEFLGGPTKDENKLPFVVSQSIQNQK